MNNHVIMHINYCEQGQTFPDLCKKAADWGFDGIEFRSKNLKVEQSMEDYLDVIHRSVEAAGLKEVLFGYPSPDMMLPEAAKRKESIRMGLAFYKLAKRLFGAKLRVCNAFTGSLQNPCKNVPYGPNYEYHGSYVAGEDQWKWAVEGYKVVGDAVAKLDLQLAYETHMGYLHDMPEPVKKLVDLIGRPSIGVNLDYGNIIYLKNAPSLKDTIEGLGKRIFYCHLKNSAPLPTGGRLPTSLADGEINHREYLALLKKIRFDGPIGIEAPRPGDREWFAKQDLAYIRSVMADVG